MTGTTHEGGRPQRWRAVLLSILVHAAIVAAVGWSWWRWHAPARAPQQLAIEATVVASRSTRAAPAPATAPAAPAPPAAEPAPKPAEPSKAEEEARLERQKEAEAQAAAARQKEEQETAERNAREAQERAEQEKAQREAKEKSRRESELRAQVAAEERINAARGSADEAAWLALIRDRVTRHWIRPPSARAGVNCEVLVTQIPGGTVTNVQIGSCNGDAAVRQSIADAVYRASPLPSPTNPDLFDRNLKFNFHPDD